MNMLRRPFCPSKSGLSSRCEWTWLWSVLPLSLALLCLRLVWLSHTPEESYIAVVDGGSTGTRIYVYKWINPQDPAKKLPTLQLIPPSAAANRIPRRPGIQAYNRVETLPGLNQFVGTEKLASESLGPLLSWARAVIPTKTQAQSPVFLFATGGVRALPVKDRETLMAGVQTVLKASGLKFEVSWATTMSGVDEGMYGWVAVNYALGRLSPGYITQDASSKSIVLPAGNETVNVLDMGGASVEITGEKRGQQYPEAPDMQHIDVAGCRYSLQSETFAHAGLNAAFDVSVSILLNSSTVEFPTIMHPCLQVGYNETYIPLARRTDAKDESFVRLIGDPSLALCKDLAEKVSTFATCKPHCKLGGPTRVGEVAALNGFYVVWKFFKLEKRSNSADLRREGVAFCNRTWNSIKGEMEGVVELDKYCFRAFYMSHLLEKVLYVKPNQLTVMDETVTWTMGAALVGGYIAKLHESPFPPEATWWSSQSIKHTLRNICGLLGLLCLLSLVWRARSRNMYNEPGSLDESRTGQLPIVVVTGEPGPDSNPANETGQRWGRETFGGMAQRRASHSKLSLLG